MLRSAALASVAAIVSVAVLSACGGSSGDPADADDGSRTSRVIASTAIWADVVSASTCGEVRVNPLIPSGVDAHEFEPTVQDADRLRDADVVFVNGLGLETELADTLRSAGSAGVEVVELGTSMNPIGDDPHVWMDPDRVALAIPAITDALLEVPDLGVDESRLKDCADGYVQKLRSLAKQMDRDLAAIPPNRRKLVTNHENLGYFADRFNFKIVGALIPSTSSLGEADPRTLDELADTMRSAEVNAVFVDAVGTRRLAESLVERLGGDVRVKTLFVESLSPAGGEADTYLTMMSTDAARIAAALNR